MKANVTNKVCRKCGQPLEKNRREYNTHFYLYGTCSNQDCSMRRFEVYLGQDFHKQK